MKITDNFYIWGKIKYNLVVIEMKKINKILSLLFMVSLLSIPLLFSNNYNIVPEKKDYEVSFVSMKEAKFDKTISPKLTKDETDEETSSTSYSSSTTPPNEDKPEPDNRDPEEKDTNKKNDIKDEEEEIIDKHSIQYRVEPLTINDEDDDTKEDGGNSYVPPESPGNAGSSGKTTSSTSKESSPSSTSSTSTTSTKTTTTDIKISTD